MSWGHKLHILNKYGEHIATVKQVVLTFLPRFEFYENEKYIGSIQKKISLLTPQYAIDFNGWSISGNIFEWDYDDFHILQIDVSKWDIPVFPDEASTYKGAAYTHHAIPPQIIKDLGTLNDYYGLHI